MEFFRQDQENYLIKEKNTTDVGTREAENTFNYYTFGDFVAFDTTFKINKENQHSGVHSI